jgi:hypothetical protein
MMTLAAHFGGASEDFTISKERNIAPDALSDLLSSSRRIPFRLDGWLGSVHIRLCHSMPTRIPRLARARDGGDRDTDQSSNKQSGQTRTKLTFLVLTFEEGIPLVVANF